MRWLELIVELVKAVAWPATALLVAWMFRERVRSLLSRTGKLKFPGGEWEAVVAAEENLRAEIAGSAPVLVPAPSVAKSAEELSSRVGVDDDLVEGAAIALEQQRKAFEDVVQRAAEWGAARGRAGGRVEGLAVLWGNDGPKLSLPSNRDIRELAAQRRLNAIARGRKEVEALEQMVKRAEAESPNSAAFLRHHLTEHREWLADLESSEEST